MSKYHTKNEKAHIHTHIHWHKCILTQSSALKVSLFKVDKPTHTQKDSHTSLVSIIVYKRSSKSASSSFRQNS